MRFLSPQSLDGDTSTIESNGSLHYFGSTSSSIQMNPPTVTDTLVGRGCVSNLGKSKTSVSFFSWMRSIKYKMRPIFIEL